MTSARIGLLWDSVSNNTGDQAIGLVLQKFFKERAFDFDVLNPFSYEPNQYSTIVVGGGELLRELGDPFYDCFRVQGNHILNSTGIYKPDHLEYLNDYALVTVRTLAEKNELLPVVPSVKTRPCISLLMGDYFPRRTRVEPIGKEAIGVHVHYGTMETVPDFLSALQEINRHYHIRFIPFTHYNNDIALMRQMASRLPDASISSAAGPIDTFYEFSFLKATISSSLHASLFSYSQNVPVLAFPYLPKVAAFLSERGLSDSCFYNRHELLEKFETLLSNPPDYSQLIQADKQSVREHLNEMEAVVRAKQNGQQSFEPKAPWAEKPSGARQYHHVLMNWLHSTGQFIADIQSLKSTLDEKDKILHTLTEQAAEKEFIAGELAVQVAEKEQRVQLLSTQVEETQVTNRALSAQVEETGKTNQALQEQLTRREHELKEIQLSRAWRLAVFLRQIRLILAPVNSRRARVLRFFARIFIQPWVKVRHALRYRRDLALMRSSSLYDGNWYLKQNPDVAQARMDPLIHYLHNGGFEDRDPGPGFSSHYYLAANEDVKAAGINPLLHYLKNGIKEGRPIQSSSWTEPARVESQPSERAQSSAAGNSQQPSRRLGRLSVKELGRNALINLNIWTSRHTALRNLIKPFIPSRVKARLIRVVQVHEMVTSSPIVVDPSATLSDWDSYLQLSGRVYSMEQNRLARFVPQKPALVTLQQVDLVTAARSLQITAQPLPEVSIIIPVHGNPRLTLECLTAIAHNTDGIKYEIIIVDDGSDLETAELVKAVPNIVLIRNDERLGFTQTCNRGASAARGRYVLFLNNDAQVTRGWLGHLLNIFSEYEQVGAVGPKVIYPDGRLQEAGNIINQDGTTVLTGLMDDPDLPRYNFLREVDYCSAVCLLVATEIFHEVGGFDEMYSPAYYEDVDLCLKIRASGRKVFYCPDAAVIHHLSATSNRIDSSFKLQLVARNRQRLLERWQDTLDELNRVRLIAFYLPQFHPIPENDLWWGKGFTEWTNVTRARPNYEGHYQPHLPADLGFYDLRAPEIMEQQVELAKRYRIDGFCYYYYWFHGKRLLELPLERMLETGKPDFPFCLCWANENWSRRWDGSEENILIAQNHTDEDDRAVIEDIGRYMRHPRYIRVHGKPVLLIYRAALFPDIKRTIEIWRENCRANGIGEIYLITVKSFELANNLVDPSGHGFDAAIEFPPHNFMRSISVPTNILNREFTGAVGDYSENILSYLSGNGFEPGRYNHLTVFPRWDNTPRRQNAPFIFENSSPGAYQAWLEKSIETTRQFKSGDERLVFINAWNEWAEGNHLEPDKKFGHRYLEATRNAVEKWQLK